MQVLDWVMDVLEARKAIGAQLSAPVTEAELEVWADRFGVTVADLDYRTRRNLSDALRRRAES